MNRQPLSGTRPRRGRAELPSGALLHVGQAQVGRQGGGNQKNLEVYNADTPTGAASVGGTLSAPADVELSPGTPESIFLDHVAGNEGIYIESVMLSGADAADFSITNPPPDPFLLPIGGSAGVTVEYTGVAADATAWLDVCHTGGATTSVELRFVPEPGALTGIASGFLTLMALHRRRERRIAAGSIRP